MTEGAKLCLVAKNSTLLMVEKREKLQEEKTERWHAIYTKSRCEKKVAEMLEAQGIICYCPLQKIVKRYTDRVKKVETVVFRSYVFVKIQKRQYAEVRQVPHVVNFVYWLKEPAIIREVEIDAIKRFLSSDGQVEIDSYAPKINQKMIVDSGPFRGQEGLVQKIFKKKIVLFLEQLGLKVTLVLK